MGRHDRKARRHPRVKPQGILELNPQGFGFVKTAEGEFFIPASKVYGAFPGDLVEVSLDSSSSRKVNRGATAAHHRLTARVSKVLMRACETLIGRYEVAEPFGVVVPENPAIPYDIFTLRSENPLIEDGSFVEVEILEYPSRNSAATGKVLRVLGHEGDSDLDIEMIIADHKLETKFSDAALIEAKNLRLDWQEALTQGYRDLRSEFVFTIDPQDARDYDDAVSLELKDGRYHLSVYIADVSRYVLYNSSIDLDARRRATSVYLADRVLPMLPEALSNDLCSLVPGQPRATLGVKAVIRKDGSVESYEVFPAIISSKARLSYEQAQELIVQDDSVFLEAFSHAKTPFGAIEISNSTAVSLREILQSLHRLTETLFERRYKAGCMDFERVEARVLLDDDNHPIDVVFRRRTEATRCIEEAMILANSLVAQWLSVKGMPCVYRVHDVPDAEALYSLYQILQEYTLFRDIDKQGFCDGNPRVLQEVLKRSHNRLEGELVDSLLLRSMKRAVYQTDVMPHYGLALETYCHFTSPIRRYPDLLVHRMVKEILFGHTETFESQKNSLPWMAEHSSKAERIAARAEYRSRMVKLIEFMQKDIGSTFSATIVGVSTFGLRLRLDNTAQGILRIEELGDEYFSYNPKRYTLTGTDTGKTYRLGERLRVVLSEALVRERCLIFKL